MITLRPPFRAENMEGLYTKVVKGNLNFFVIKFILGQYNKIPERFSNEFHELVKMLLQVQPESRPNCGIINIILLILDQILKHSLIIKKLETFKAFDDNEESALLQTIRIPKNLLLLTDKLPQPNYEKQIYGRKNLTHTDEKKDLPNIKIGKKQIASKKRSEKKLEIIENLRNDTHENKQNSEKIKLNIPTQEYSRNILNTENNSNKLYEINDQDVLPNKKRRYENERSLDNINNQNQGQNNIRVLKSMENVDSNNVSLLRDKSPYEDIPRKRTKEIVLLPNIKNQINYEVKYVI